MRPLLRFDKVGCVRGGQLLFERLDLRVGPGEALRVAGPNGSGKSSLIRLAAGLLRPVSGTIERAALALADELLAFDRERSLIANLAFWQEPAGKAGRLWEAVDALDLGHLAQVPVGLLSTGQRKRATLARVAASAAPLWLLDEPANGLDSPGLRNLAALIAGHRAAGGAVVAASHVDLPGDWSTLELGS